MILLTRRCKPSDKFFHRQEGDNVALLPHTFLTIGDGGCCYIHPTTPGLSPVHFPEDCQLPVAVSKDQPCSVLSPGPSCLWMTKLTGLRACSRRAGRC